MSFLHAERLWLLLGVVALAAGYLVLQRHRARTIARYTNPELYDRLAPDRPGPVRHVAPVLALAALALTLVAAAQPTREEQVPREKGVVVLAIDTSLSMQSTDISPTRIEAARAGAKSFVDKLPSGIEVGLVSFDSTARLLVSPTTDHASVDGAIATLTTNERTATGEGVYTSLDAVKAALTDEKGTSSKQVPAAIVLLSDGVQTVGRSVDAAASAAADAKVPISTIAYGTPTGTVTIDGQTVGVPADDTTMAAVAKTTGGTSFRATSAGELQDVYSHIQTTIGYETVPREVGRAFIGGALFVLLLAGGVAIFTSARPL
jgi:Ca-activated chloride channel homolog